jgi:hypothetical protein
MSVVRFQIGFSEENYERTHYDTGRFIVWLFPLALDERIDYQMGPEVQHHRLWYNEEGLVGRPSH